MREDQALRPDMPELRNAAADRACVKITRGLIEEYINGLRRKQHPFDSRKTYRRALQLFCDSLPESMEVDGSTLLRWRKELLEKGYAARTINVSVSVVNSFLNWLGHREFQRTGWSWRKANHLTSRGQSTFGCCARRGSWERNGHTCGSSCLRPREFRFRPCAM